MLPQQDASRILRLPDVKARTGLSRASIYAFIKNGHFPSSISLGARSVGWLESEIDLWIAGRIALRRPTTILQP